MMGAAEAAAISWTMMALSISIKDQSAAVAPVPVKDKAPSETILAESDQTMQAAGTA
jgi:hypothetical protein